MKKPSLQCLCDYDESTPKEKFFSQRMKGDAAAFACAFPTKESFAPLACERTVEICTDSYIRRPSTVTEAALAIDGFMNMAVYALQEPGKIFFCNFAAVYILRNRARMIVSGNAVIYHFCDGKLVGTYEAGSDPLFGKTLKVKFTPPPEAVLPKGENAFLLCCGNGDTVFSADKATAFASDAETAAQRLAGYAPPSRSTTLGVVLPQRNGIFSDLFGKER